jgi:predicted enzyme related to lactoylglutathione lyase
MKFKHQQIQYIEFLSQDLARIKKFYFEAFGWKFTDYGPDYTVCIHRLLFFGGFAAVRSVDETVSSGNQAPLRQRLRNFKNTARAALRRVYYSEGSALTTNS